MWCLGVVGRGLEVNGDDGGSKFKVTMVVGPNLLVPSGLIITKCTAAGVTLVFFHSLRRHAICAGVHVKQALRCPLSRGAEAQGRLHAANRAAMAIYQPTILSAGAWHGISAWLSHHPAEPPDEYLAQWAAMRLTPKT